jgi:predicted solute-binding protein
MKTKDELAMEYYGCRYFSLCGDRKRNIDRTYDALKEKEEQEKK